MSELLSYTGFAVAFFSGVAVASVFVLRQRAGSCRSPYSTWGYPVIPALFVLASAMLLLNEVASRPGPVLAGLGVIAIGVPLYWRVRRRDGVAPSAPGTVCETASL